MILGDLEVFHLGAKISTIQVVKFQQDLYNNEMTHDEYEESFMIFKPQHPAYIAMVQMTIAANGKCLLQIGWGHCIDFTSYLFKYFHSPELLCIEKSIIIKTAMHLWS